MDRVDLKNLINKANKKKPGIDFMILIASLLLLTVLALPSIANFLGFAYAINTEGGTIYEITVVQSFATEQWAGIYGAAIRATGFSHPPETITAGEIHQTNLFFDCIETDPPGGQREFYATVNDSIDFNSLRAATSTEIETWIGSLEGADRTDSANNTFTDSVIVYVGITAINASAVYSYRNNGTVVSEFWTAALATGGGDLVFAIFINNAAISSYNTDENANFQVLLPMPVNGTETWNWFTDPFDACPEGQLGESIDVNVYGQVNGSDTDGPLINASVVMDGQEVFTDENGTYNISTTLILSRYNIVAFKAGYDPGVDNVTFTANQTVVEKNFILVPVTTAATGGITITVRGWVFDQDGNLLDNATVGMGGVSDTTTFNGSYQIRPTVIPGGNLIIAYRPEYDNYWDNITVEANTTTIDYNITLNASNLFATGPYDTISPQVTARKVVRVIARPTPPKVEKPGTEVYVPTREINKEVLENTFIEENFGIFNFKSNSISMTFSLTEGLRNVMVLDTNQLTIQSNSWGDLLITIYGLKVGDYNGTLQIRGDVVEDIPVNIKVVKSKLPIETLLMEATLLDKTIYPSDFMRFRLKLQNLLTEQGYKVGLTYTILDQNGTKITNASNDVEIITSSNLYNTLEIPEETLPGEYILRIDAKYLGLTSTLSVPFRVTLPFYLYTIIGIPIWVLMMLLGFVSTGTFSYSLYKRYLESQKRYRVEVDFDTLGQPGPRAAYLGHVAETKVDAWYDLDKLTTHCIVAGATGRGKTIAAQDLIEEALLKGIAVIAFDPTAQWSGLLRKCKDKKMLSFYPRFGFKPQDARAFNGNVRQINHALEVLDIRNYMKPGEIQVFTVNKLDPKDIDIFIANTIMQIFRYGPKEERELKVILVFDEIHRVLPRFGGSGAGFIQIERACREFRKWGLGIVMISQVLADFVGEIKANINTEIQTRTVDEGDLGRISTKYGAHILRSLVRADVGVTMFQNAEYNKGRPYFINFRPIYHSVHRLSDEELAEYNKYNDVIDELAWQIEQLEQEGLDVFDMKLELKLSLDKVKSGNFNMVDIYLEGLKPRLVQQWTKLGKKPKKKEIKIVDKKALEDAITKAKEQRAAVEAKEKKEKGGEGGGGEEEEEKIYDKMTAAFTFDNGMMISSIKEISDLLDTIEQDLFSRHVNAEKNDFGTWVKKAFPDDQAMIDGFTYATTLDNFKTFVSSIMDGSYKELAAQLKQEVEDKKKKEEGDKKGGAAKEGGEAKPAAKEAAKPEEKK